jgi:hypothetical protein
MLEKEEGGRGEYKLKKLKRVEARVCVDEETGRQAGSRHVENIYNF